MMLREMTSEMCPGRKVGKNVHLVGAAVHKKKHVKVNVNGKWTWMQPNFVKMINQDMREWPFGLVFGA